MRTITMVARLAAAAAMFLVASDAFAQVTTANALCPTAIARMPHIVPLADVLQTASTVSAGAKPIAARCGFEGSEVVYLVVVQLGAGTFSELCYGAVTGKQIRKHRYLGAKSLQEYRVAQEEARVLAKSRSSLRTAVARVMAHNVGFTAIDALIEFPGVPVAIVTIARNGHDVTHVTEKLE